MSHLPALVSDLALILLTAGIVTIIFKLLKQPVVLGYIVAGFLISPTDPQCCRYGEYHCMGRDRGYLPTLCFRSRVQFQKADGRRRPGIYSHPHQYGFHDSHRIYHRADYGMDKYRKYVLRRYALNVLYNDHHQGF